MSDVKVNSVKARKSKTPFLWHSCLRWNRTAPHSLTVFPPFIPCWRLQRVKKVIGIELCQEAVEDAKVNAALNGEQAPGF